MVELFEEIQLCEKLILFGVAQCLSFHDFDGSNLILFEANSFVNTAICSFADTLFHLIMILNFIFSHFDEYLRADVYVWVCTDLVVGHEVILDGFIELLDSHVDAASFAIVLLSSFAFFALSWDITLHSGTDRQRMMEGEVVSGEDEFLIEGASDEFLERSDLLALQILGICPAIVLLDARLGVLGIGEDLCGLGMIYWVI